LFAEAGVTTLEITLPPLQDFSACGQIILAAEAYAVHERWLKERPQDYGALARERLLAGAGLRAVDYLQATRWRLQLRDQVAAAFANIDVAITASSMDPGRRRRGARRQLLAPGADAVQRHRAAGAGNPRRLQ
jgi:aspartyl-tRNA(Asn)/glutamyl-tRNA(Gln) amidotransferase subunit A